MSMQLTSLETQAKQAFNEQHYDEAISLYHQCLETESYELQDYWYLGLAYFLNGQENEAQEVWMMPLFSGQLNSESNWELELIEIVDTAIERSCLQGNLTVGKRLQEVIQEIDPNYEHQGLKFSTEYKIQKLLDEGLVAAFEKQFKDASELFLEIIKLDDTIPSVWQNLAMVYYEIGTYPQAFTAMEKAIELSPNNSNYHYGLGLILEKLNRVELGIKAYQTSLKIDATNLDAYVRLGGIFKAYNRLYDAEKIYQQAISYIPDQYGCYLNLGNLLLEQAKAENQVPPRRYQEIIEVYQKALDLNSKDHFILLGLAETYQLGQEEEKALLSFGDAAYLSGAYESAIIHYNQYLQKNPENFKVHQLLFKAYKELNNYEQAISMAEKALEINPQSHRMYKSLIFLYHSLGDLEAAFQVVAKAEKAIPENVYIKRVKQWLLPIIYDSPEEIDSYRQRFTNYLYELIDSSGIGQPEKLDQDKIAQLTNSLRQLTNFYLQYQGRDDKPLQQKYGEYVHKVLSLRFPEYVKPRSLEPGLPNRKIRVGYVSASMYSHTVGKLFLGWLKQANHENFIIHSYAINDNMDFYTQKYYLFSDVFHHIPTQNDLSEIAETILQDKLDILVFPDVGMMPMMTLLAGLRLAPIQCVTWGHPITTGSPTMDYFLTSDWMEPENGEDHYTEKLIRLPNISIAYGLPRPVEDPGPRAKFNLSDEAVVYLSCQSTYKYLPQYDYIFPRIALEVPNAQFAFLESGNSPKITQQFRDRLKRAFAEVGLDSEKYCVILPRLKHGEYLSLNLLSDVFLDTLAWSGGNTTLEALACCLPVVTCPGEFMRGRHAYAILKTLGIEETITDFQEAYIAKAIELGKNPQSRQELKAKIKANHHRLFEDQVAVDALESFYEQAVKDFPSLV